MSRVAPGTPRWTVLLALAAGVFCAHILLLAGGLPSWHPEANEVEAASGQVMAVQTRTLPSDATTDAPPAPPVTTSTVRWIVPKPVAQRAPQAPKPKRLVPPEPAEPPMTAAPVVTATSGAPAAAPASETPTPAAPASEPVQVAAAPADAPAVPASEDRPVAEAQAVDAGAASTPLPPAQPSGSVALQYDVSGSTKGLSYRADARLDWQVNGPRYTAEMEISAFLMGSRAQTSSGRLGPEGLIPERFGDRRRGEKATHFDYTEQRIRYSSNAPNTALLPGVQDRLSVFLQLGALLHARPESYPAGQTIRLQVASTGDAEVWQFQVGPQEQLALPAGSVAARRLTRSPRRPYDNTVDIWLAPALQFLPVRIRVTEHNGDMADQQLRHLPALSQAPVPIQ